MTKVLIDRSTVEKALDALKCVDLQSLVPDYGSGHYSVARLDGPQVKSAITALEASLTAPAREPVVTAGVFTLAHLWAQQAYFKGLGRPCDIDGARGAFEQALKALAEPVQKPHDLNCSYHPCTSILIKALKEMKAYKVLAEWDKARAIVDARANKN